MRKVTITLSIVAIFALFVIFVMPYLIGLIIANEYPKVIKQAANPPVFAAKVLSYHRGWFDSDARVQFDIKLDWPKIQNKPYFTDDTISFVVDEKIKHGPIIFFRENGKRSFAIAKAVILNQANITGIQFYAKTIWTLTDTLVNHFNSEKITLGNAVQHLSIYGLRGDVSYRPSNKKIGMSIKLDHANIMQLKTNRSHGEKKLLLAIQNLRANANFYHTAHMWYGWRKLAIEKLHLTTENNKTLVFNHLFVQTSQNKKNENTDIKIMFANKKLQGNGLDVGPMNLSLAINDLNTVALTQFVNKSFMVKANHLLGAQEFSALYQPFLALVNKGFSINLNQFFINTQDGPVQASATLSIPKQAGQINLDYLMFNTRAVAALNVPRNWLMKILTHFYLNTAHTPQQKIEEWIQTNWLRQQGNTLILKLDYKNGRLLVNGRPLQRTVEHKQLHQPFQLKPWVLPTLPQQSKDKKQG